MLNGAMLKLEPPDNFALSAALGWLELGNAREALAELDHISPANQPHPAVLEMRFTVLAELKQWDEALAAASELVRILPNKAGGWLHQAYALRRASGGGLPQAWEALLPAAEKFPKQFLIAFNLACYACQLQRLDEARDWLKRAAKIKSETETLAMALADSDLEPLWPELRAKTSK